MADGRSQDLFSLKRLGFLCLVLCVLPLLYFLSTSSNSLINPSANSMAVTRYSVDQMREFAFKNSIATDYKPSYYTRWNFSFSRILEDFDNRFDITGDDVLVFVHIQKTAGTSFERFLVRHLNITQPCVCNKGRKRCSCRRPGKPSQIWLFSRYSTGWVCGLHADFTELFVSGCVDNTLDKKEGAHRKRRYFYTSFLREPLARFISEWSHVARGATWLAARHVCNGRPPTPDQLPLCFDPRTGWEGVSLDEFLSCPYNLAFNRQTRMLADLTLVNCYDRSAMSKEARDRIMLESAKANLRSLAFFGIKELMAESQWMFEQLFQLQFTADMSDWKKSKSRADHISEEQWELIRKRNHLDIQLYEFALKLFEKRLKELKEDIGEQPQLRVSSRLRVNSTANDEQKVEMKEEDMEKWEKILDEDAKEDQVEDADDYLFV